MAPTTPLKISSAVTDILECNQSANIVLYIFTLEAKSRQAKIQASRASFSLYYNCFIKQINDHCDDLVLIPTIITRKIECMKHENQILV